MKKTNRKQCSAVVTVPAEPAPLTADEFRALLLRARDNAVRWLVACTVARTPAGSGAARTVLLCTCDELERLDRLAPGQGRRVDLFVNGLDISRLQFGSNVPQKS